MMGCGAGKGRRGSRRGHARSGTQAPAGAGSRAASGAGGAPRAAAPASRVPRAPLCPARLTSLQGRHRRHPWNRRRQRRRKTQHTDVLMQHGERVGGLGPDSATRSHRGRIHARAQQASQRPLPFRFKQACLEDSQYGCLSTLYEKVNISPVSGSVLGCAVKRCVPILPLHVVTPRRDSMLMSRLRSSFGQCACLPSAREARLHATFQPTYGAAAHGAAYPHPIPARQRRPHPKLQRPIVSTKPLQAMRSA